MVEGGPFRLVNILCAITDDDDDVSIASPFFGSVLRKATAAGLHVYLFPQRSLCISTAWLGSGLMEVSFGWGYRMTQGQFGFREFLRGEGNSFQAG